MTVGAIAWFLTQGLPPEVNLWDPPSPACVFIHVVGSPVTHGDVQGNRPEHIIDEALGRHRYYECVGLILRVRYLDLVVGIRPGCRSSLRVTDADWKRRPPQGSEISGTNARVPAVRGKKPHRRRADVPSAASSPR